MEIEQIDNWIEEMLEFLASLQNEDGSFSTYRLQPYYQPQKDWYKHDVKVPYDTVLPLIPLSFTNTDKSKQITEKSIHFLLNNSLDKFLWTWTDTHLSPYFMDDTSMCSYFLERNGVPIKNKEFLNEFIDDKLYYRYCIWVKKKSKNISLPIYLKLKWHQYHTKRSWNIINEHVRLDDSEFTSTCVNLLYIGENEKNINLWKNVKKQFINKDFDFIFYIGFYHAFYCYARLCKYGKYHDMLPNSKVIDSYITDLKKDIDIPTFFHKHVFLANALLFFDVNIKDHPELLNTCIKNIQLKKYTEHTAYYSSHIPTINRPREDKYYTCFGSSAITCSLYLEFLNLYRKRFYGKYYGEE